MPYIISSGITSDGIILENDTLTVLNGGIATKTTINSRGSMYVSSGGTANNTTVNSSGYMFVSSSGMASNTTVNSGTLLVSSGGTAINTTVKHYGEMNIADGCIANSTIVDTYGHFFIWGGSAVSTFVNDGGGCIIFDGGVANSTNVNSGGDLEVFCGGTANNTFIHSGGALCVESGGTAVNITVSKEVHLILTVAPDTLIQGISNGQSFEMKDAFLSSFIVDKRASLYISRGGIAKDISVCGYLYVAPSGIVNNVQVNSGAKMVVANGGTATIAFNPWQGIIVSSNGADITYLERDMAVYYGGEATGVISKAKVVENLNVNYTESAIVYSGGTATIAFNPWQGLIVSSNGADITYLERDMAVYYGGNVGFISKTNLIENFIIDSGNSVIVYSDGFANSIAVMSQGELDLFNGATANNIVVSSGGNMIVSSGGTAAHIEARSGALLDLSIAPDTYIEGTYTDSAFEVKGGSVTYYSVNSGNILRISSGGVASRAYVYAGGSLFVSNGGTASRTTVSNGTMSILSGGVADSTTVNGGCLHVSSGGVASNITNNGSVIVSSGAMIDAVNVKNECWLYVSSGGTATNITASSTKLCFVVAPDTFITGTSNASTFEIKDGMVSDYGVYQSGWLNILSGCTANNITVNLSGFMGVEGTANSVTIHGSGYVTVSSGGLVNSVTVNNYGRMYVSGGTANYTTVNDGKYCYVSVFSGTADYAIVNGGSMLVSNGTVNYATVNGGYMRVFSGTADNAIVNGGSMYVSGGSASNVSVSKGTLRLGACIASDTKVYSGGIVSTQQTRFTGKITIADGGVIHAGQGTVIDFDISRLAPNMGALLNNLSLIQDDAPAFTLTVSDLQWNGTYKLAQGVTEFDNLISVKSTASQTIHMVAVDETANVDGIEYTLKLTDGTLAVTVAGGIDIPIIPVVADITEPTRKDVTLTANYSESAVMREYSFDNETWYVYSEPVTCSVNGTVYFLGKDQRGYVNEIASYEVTNIDNRPPDDPVVMPDITDPTNTDVLVSAMFEEDTTGEYSFDRETWQIYTEPVRFERNGTVYFRARDDMGNESEVVSYAVTNIDKVKPVVTLSGDNQTPLRKSTLTASVDDGSKIYYCIGDSDLTEYTGPIEVKANGIYHFQATDAAGNIGTAEITFGNIDTTVPVISNLAASTTGPAKAVTVTADFADDVELAQSLYKLGTNGEWTAYDNGVTVTANSTVYFKAVDAAGNESEVVSYTVSNIDKVAPTTPTGLDAIVSEQKVALVWDVSTDDSVVKEYVVTYSLDGQKFTVRTSGTSYVLKDADFGTWSWSVQAVDAAGNESEISVGEAFTVSGFQPYIVEYSTDSFEHVLRLTVSTDALDSFRLPTGTYEWRMRSESVSDWQTGDPIVSVADNVPTFVKSDADGNDDLFFANACGVWEVGYVAQHVGSIEDLDWVGTKEYAAVSGKNKLADIFEGSDDANILLLTDDANGDALFVDDIYTELPGTLEEQQARIARINEIRAGAGDDIVDMTSQQFEYIGGGMIVYGGDGNDTIWANKGTNTLFGDAGNDRIVGASGDDVIAGGIGDDKMHGGGGDDVFTFCGKWGKDTVQQLETGKVTLWFASGGLTNWDESELTYSDGENSVTVKGVTAEQITLKFGDDGSAQFASLSDLGAFDAFTSRKIFEEATLA